MSTENLMAALEFTLEDLSANRQGHLSEAQKTRLINDRWKYTRGYVIFGLPWLIIAFLPGVRFLTDTASKRDTNDLIAAGFFLALTLVMLFLAFQRWRHITDDVAGDTARSSNGPVTVVLTNPRMQAYKLKSSDVELEVRSKIASAFKSRSTYRIFYTPRSKLILSAEAGDSGT